jgi:integrase
LTFCHSFATTFGMTKPAKKAVRTKPVHVEKFRDCSIPIYSKPVGNYQSFLVSYYSNGRRIQERAKTLEAARTKAKAAIKQITEGSGRHVALTAVEVADYTAAIRTLRPLGNVSLVAAVDSYARAVEALGDDDIVSACRAYRTELARRNEVTRAKFPDVVKSYLLSMEKAGASGRYLQDLKHRLEGRAAKHFRGYIDTIPSSELSAWIDSLKIAHRTRANFRGALLSLFTYAKQNGHLARDRQTEAELLPSRSRLNSAKAKKPVSIYTPTEIAKILHSAPEHLRPLFALGAFAGLRSAEIFDLKWGDINKRHIVVEAAGNKNAARRLVPVQTALTAWLATCKRGEDDAELCARWSHESTFTATMSQAVRDAGVEPVANGLRHSFISYRVAKIKDVQEVALEAGNSPQMIFSNYRDVKTREGKLVTPALAAAWFKALPSSASNVLPFAKAS